MVSATAAFALFMMVSATAAFTVAVMMTATAAFTVAVMMAATAAFTVVVMIATTTTRLMIMMGMLVLLSGGNCDFTFHRPGDFRQFFDECVRIFCLQSQLLRGKGDGGFLHLRQGVEFAFNFGGAVGAVQILDDIYLLFHIVPP